MSIRRHSSYNLLGSLLPLAFSLITIPLYLRLIGPDRYGVLAIAWLLLGYFGLFDLGLGRAVTQRLAALVTDTPHRRASAFKTALAANLIMGGIGALILYPAAWVFFTYYLKVDPALRSEIIAATPYLALSVPIATVTAVLTGAMQGRERFFEVNAISVTSTALFQFLPLLVAWQFGPDLVWLLIAALGARIVAASILWVKCRDDLMMDAKGTYDRGEMKLLLTFGGWVMVSGLIGPLMVISDRFLIGGLLGAVAVTIYTVPFQIAQRSALIPGAVANAIFPRLSSASETQRAELSKEARRSIAVIMTPLVVGGILLMEPFLKLWLGSVYQPSSTLVGQIILVGFWINGLAMVPFARLQADGRPRTTALIHLAELGPYFAALYFLMKHYGVAGAAIAYSLRCAVDYLALEFLASPKSFFDPVVPVMAIWVLAALAAAVQFAPFSLYWLGSGALILMAAVTAVWFFAPTSIKSRAMAWTQS